MAARPGKNSGSYGSDTLVLWVWRYTHIDLKKAVITQPLPHQHLKESGFDRRVISWAPLGREVSGVDNVSLEELLVNTAGDIVNERVLAHAALC